MTAGRKIVGRNDRAQSARGCDGLQPRDARADDQHARRSNRAGSSGQHGEDPRQLVGGDQHRLVAADGGHRGERVHALRARDARHQLNRKRGHAGGSNFLQSMNLAQRPQKADQHLAAAEQRKVGFAGAIIRAVTQHLHDYVGGAENLSTAGENFAPLSTYSASG